MSITPIGAELRRLVMARAGFLCEYCLMRDADTGVGFEIDHVISEKHGGPTEEWNLAYCCPNCNRGKGSDIGSIDWQSGDVVRFFNPRRDRWSDHFRLEGARIVGLTPIGNVTVRILRMNENWRVQARRDLIAAARYPNGPTGPE